MPKLVCQDIVEVVTAYLEGAMSAPEREAFERHLAKCDHCRAYVAQMRVTIAAAGRLAPEAVDEETRGVLLRLFRDWNEA